MKKIFISYSHEDVAFKEKLVQQLRVLQLEGFCDIWEDSRIQIGIDWFTEIQTAIDEAHIAIMMISASFLTSPFIRSEEIPRMLKLRQEKGLILLPLFVKPCAWKQVSWLSSIQGFPSGPKTLMEMDEPQQLRQLTTFAEHIHDILKNSHRGHRDHREKKKDNAQSHEPDLSPGMQSPDTDHRHRHNNQLLTPLPPRRIELIGRETELQDLENMLNQSQLVVLVNGLGGIGKTEVCKTFFYKHYEGYEYAAWVDWVSSLKESLVYALGSDKSSFIQVNERDTLDQRFEKIIDRLKGTREPFLLVLDNIENPEDSDLLCLSQLPPQIKILTSSRSHIESYKELNLDFLNPDQCKQLFYRYYKGKSDELVDHVIQLCGYHTLTVELLARTAYYSAISIGKLYEALKSNGFNLNAVTGGKIPTFWHNETERKTFLDHLVKVFDISRLAEEELFVLMNMSVLPSRYIPMEWIKEWLKLPGMDELNGLVEKGWLKRDDEFRIYMHPVMQEVVRYKTKPDAKKCRILIRSLADKIECKPGDNPIHKKEFIPYGESVVQWMDEEGNDENLANLSNNVSGIFQDIGQFGRALKFQEKAIKIQEKILAPNHPNLAASYNNISGIYLDIGQFDRALEFQMKVLKIDEAGLNENHLDLATSYNNMSIIYQKMGQLDLAAEFQLKALKIDEAGLDANHPHIASLYNNVSTLFIYTGQLDRALEIKLMGLKIEEKIFDKNHPQLAASYNNVSMIYKGIDQLDRALEIKLKGLKIEEEIFDKNHPQLAASYYNVSLICKDMKNYTTAESYAQKAVTIMESNFPEGHPDLNIMKRNLEAIKKLCEEERAE